MFETFLFYLYGASFPLSIFAINLCLSLFFIIFFLKLFSAKIKINFPLSALFLFIFIQIVSAFFSDNCLSSLSGVKDFWALFAGFLAGYSLSKPVTDKMEKFKMFISISTSLSFVMALIQFFFGTDFQKQRLFATGGIASMPGKAFFTHHLTFAAVMGIVFLFFFSDILNKKANFFTYIALLSSFSGLILSQSRGYFLVLLISAFLLLFKNHKKILSIFILFSVISFSLFLIFSPSHIKERVKSLFSLKNGSFAERVYLLRSGFDMFKNHPLLGVGPNQYQRCSEEFKKPYEDKIIYPEGKGFRTKCHTHNIYLMILIESGVTGLFSFLLFIFSLLKNLLTIREEDKFAFFSPFLFFLLAGFFEYNLGDAEVVSLFAFLMGLSIAVKRNDL